MRMARKCLQDMSYLGRMWLNGNTNQYQKQLLSGDVVEWARIEFKETWDAAASLKSICAFANDLDNWGGGYIVIGVQEEWKILLIR